MVLYFLGGGGGGSWIVCCCFYSLGEVVGRGGGKFIGLGGKLTAKLGTALCQ